MSDQVYATPVTVSATRAIKSIFEGPNWPSNLLWLSISVLLQSFVVGQVFLFGYGAALLQYRAGVPGRKSPDIDSNRLGDYFMQGLWPFLVYLVASLLITPIVFLPVALVAGLLMFVGMQSDGINGILVVLGSVPLFLLLVIPMIVLLSPALIRAMICQDFMQSFDFKWCMSFIKLTFWEMVLSSAILFVLGVVIYLVGSALFCVGALPATGIISGATMHLLAQWYELFLSRGGEEVQPTVSPVADSPVVDATIV